MTESYDDEERRKKVWHLDKRIPVILFLTLAIQMGGTIWWASEISSVVKIHSLSIIETNKRISDIENRERDGIKLSERVVRVETMLENVQHTVNKIDNAIINDKKRIQQ